MRAYSALHPTEGIPVPPDTIQTMLLAAATAQAMDYAASTLTHIVRITAMTTAGASHHAHVNLQTTQAALPSSGTATGTSSTGVSVPVLGDRTIQVPPGSTGWSAIARTSGYVIMEQWRI